jgi:hypothetical protein
MKKDKQGDPVTPEGLERMLANPYYCINIDENLCTPHLTMVSEDMWKEAAKNTIKEKGVDVFLDNLLENLKGNYYAGEGDAVAGYMRS